MVWIRGERLPDTDDTWLTESTGSIIGPPDAQSCFDGVELAFIWGWIKQQRPRHACVHEPWLTHVHTHARRFYQTAELRLVRFIVTLLLCVIIVFFSHRWCLTKYFLFSAEEMKMLDWSCLMRVSHDKMIMIQKNPPSCFLPPSSDCLSPISARHLWSFRGSWSAPRMNPHIPCSSSTMLHWL